MVSPASVMRFHRARVGTVRPVALAVLALVSTSCATNVAPRVAAPLMPGTIVVGATAGVTTGQVQDVDIGVPFVAGGGGAVFAAPVLVRDRLQLEVDGALVGGVKAEANAREMFIGAGSGARLWYALDDKRAWRIGWDTNIAAFMEVLHERSSGRRGLLAEFRPMIAHEVTDFVWLGARPGMIVPVEADGFLPMIDVPVSLAVQTHAARVGIEAGIQGPYFLPITAARVGVVLALAL